MLAEVHLLRQHDRQCEGAEQCCQLEETEFGEKQVENFLDSATQGIEGINSFLERFEITERAGEKPTSKFRKLHVFEWHRPKL